MLYKGYKDRKTLQGTCRQEEQAPTDATSFCSQGKGMFEAGAGAVEGDSQIFR